ncbi:MAG: tetratricopeptide repeat protein [Bryobacterales bacterium]|nr:tetratricopeptide repeat protein [Bryobacterales bacterium]
MAKARKSKSPADTPVSPTIRPGNERLLLGWAGLTIVLACILIYAQTASHDFVRLDDTMYLHENPNVNSGLTWANVRWALTSAGYYYWQPLTWISHMIDVQLFGLRAGPHHVVNLVWHCLNAVLLLLALHRLTGTLWRSAIAAALFAVHPLRVESVAWIAERKDVLSGFFWMLTLLAYASYARRPAANRLRLATVLFGLGLMSKPSVVTLPFILVLLDYWPLRRWRDFAGCKAMLMEKTPMLVLAGIVSFITFAGQRKMGAIVSLEALPIYFRVWNGLVSYMRYLGKMFWPSGLGVMYPFGKIPPGTLFAAIVLLAAVTALVWLRRKQCPHLIVGWLWFLGAMVPMLGLAQAGTQAMADRFTYLPMIGIAIAVSWALAALAVHFRIPLPVRAACIGLMLGILSFVSLLQTSHWKDSTTLFEHTLAVTKDNDSMLINLASVKRQAGDNARALELYEEAIRLEPAKSMVRLEAALVAFRLRKIEQARGHFNAVLAMEPNNPTALRGIADCLIAEGKKEEARRQLQQLLNLWPNDIEAKASLFLLGN